jgi:hypothetical protein
MSKSLPGRERPDTKDPKAFTCECWDEGGVRKRKEDVRDFGICEVSCKRKGKVGGTDGGERKEGEMERGREREEGRGA